MWTNSAWCLFFTVFNVNVYKNQISVHICDICLLISVHFYFLCSSVCLSFDLLFIMVSFAIKESIWNLASHTWNKIVIHSIKQVKKIIKSRRSCSKKCCRIFIKMSKITSLERNKNLMRLKIKSLCYFDK